MRLPDNVIQALRAGRKVEAITRLRESTGLGLAEAKAMVDGFVDDGQPLHSEMLTPTVTSSQRSFGWLGTAAVVGTFAWMLVNSISLVGSLIILIHLEGYQKTVFTVEKLHYREDPESGLFWGFIGQVDGRSTKMYAPELADAKALGVSRLRQIYPNGHRLNVWYNPHVTDTLFQRRTLHLLPYSETLKQQQTEEVMNWLVICLFPFVVVLVVVRRFERASRTDSLISP